LRAAQDLFVRRWGEMGQTWGVPRSTAEIYALLYITGQPLSTDEIIERLTISRGNVSTCLRVLCEWGIVKREHKRPQRRDYFSSLGDVWEIFRIIAAQRKKRELDPVLETIGQCHLMLDEGELGDAAKSEPVRATLARLEAMREFMEVTDRIFTRFVTDSTSGLTRLAQVLLRAL
jgi:DNA-binding transcriptional regulator GbsR (MarR family)